MSIKEIEDSSLIPDEKHVNLHQEFYKELKELCYSYWRKNKGNGCRGYFYETLFQKHLVLGALEQVKKEISSHD